MAEDAFVSACLRMEAAYKTIRRRLHTLGSKASHQHVVDSLQVIRAARPHLIAGVGEQRAARFEQLIKAQVLEDELAADDSAAHAVEPEGIHSCIPFFHWNNT